ncbi:MAG TPA: hypothetical protein VE081_10555, partial [Sporichthyaceae bacterium]|nr:hypothetical protein [Sporichthyaceae bacterium]
MSGLIILTIGQIVLSAGPAAAHGSVDTEGLPLSARVGRALALAAAVFVAGQGLLHPVLGAARGVARRILLGVTSLGLFATVVALAGGLPAARWSILLALLPVAAAAATFRWRSS